MTYPEVLADAATAVLAHAIDALNQPDALGAPDRCYVSAGDVPADCQLLAVWAVPLARPQTGGVRGRDHLEPRAEIHVRHWRPIPTDTPPSLDVAHRAGVEFHSALWTVWSYLAARCVDRTVIDGPPPGVNAELIDVRIDHEQDTSAPGWVITLTVDLRPLLTAPAP